MTSLLAAFEIEAFERRLEEALQTGDTSNLDVIGYGEVTLAVKFATSHGDFACKRLVPFSSRAAAEHAASLIASYIEQLAGCGIDVVETETPILERPEGHVVYCVQPLLTPGTLGPDFLRFSCPVFGTVLPRQDCERGGSARASDLQAHSCFGDALARPGRAVVELGVRR